MHSARPITNLRSKHIAWKNTIETGERLCFSTIIHLFRWSEKGKILFPFHFTMEMSWALFLSARSLRPYHRLCLYSHHMIRTLREPMFVWAFVQISPQPTHIYLKWKGAVFSLIFIQFHYRDVWKSHFFPGATPQIKAVFTPHEKDSIRHRHKSR